MVPNIFSTRALWMRDTDPRDAIIHTHPIRQHRFVLTRFVVFQFFEQVSVPVKMTGSIGNLSGRKCVLKKWIVKMKPTASSASSLWIIVATLMAHPGTT